MKRKIAFRAWDKEKKEMLSWNDLQNNQVGFVHSLIGEGNWIVMQSTGLLDKNGKEVFEGDVVKCSSGCPHEIVWGGGNGMPGWWLDGTIIGVMGDYAWTGREEVIGSIYSNPELLKGESL